MKFFVFGCGKTAREYSGCHFCRDRYIPRTPGTEINDSRNMQKVIRMGDLRNSDLDPILKNECITRGLEDPEAQLLIHWMVEQTENADSRESATARIAQICRRAKAIRRFVDLYCHRHSPASAFQLAASVGFSWPLPVGKREPYDLMRIILEWESALALHRNGYAA